VTDRLPCPKCGEPGWGMTTQCENCGETAEAPRIPYLPPEDVETLKHIANTLYPAYAEREYALAIRAILARLEGKA